MQKYALCQILFSFTINWTIKYFEKKLLQFIMHIWIKINKLKIYSKTWPDSIRGHTWTTYHFFQNFDHPPLNNNVEIFTSNYNVANNLENPPDPTPLVATWFKYDPIIYLKRSQARTYRPFWQYLRHVVADSLFTGSAYQERMRR